MTDETEEEFEEEQELGGGWHIIELSPLTKQIRGYSGILLFNPFEPALLVLVDTADSWEWKDITDCTRKPNNTSTPFRKVQ